MAASRNAIAQEVRLNLQAAVAAVKKVIQVEGMPWDSN